MRSEDDAHRDVIDRLPTGWALPRDPSSVLGRLLRPLAEAAVRFEQRAEALIAEATPQTAEALIPDYERVLGPDPCLGPVHTTMTERRLSVSARWTARGGASRAHLIEVAAQLGYRITIDEFRPARAGRFRAGQRLHPERVRWTWRVNMPAAPSIRFRAGRSRAGDRLRSYGNPILECVIRRAAPSHTIVVFARQPGSQ